MGYWEVNESEKRNFHCVYWCGEGVDVDDGYLMQEIGKGVIKSRVTRLI